MIKISKLPPVFDIIKELYLHDGCIMYLRND